jgi:hypothetical protein
MIREGSPGPADGPACSRAWWCVAGLLVAAFLARGPLYLSVFPPFEGWDEYQHLAYIAHIDESGTIPVFDESRVPLSLRPLVTAMPHSRWGGEQVQQWGARSYADYWSSGLHGAGAEDEVSSSPRLYQAQHPPLAYLLAAPIWSAMRAEHPLEAIYVLRVMNLIVVAGALTLFAAALPSLVASFGLRAAVLALVCLHPLFFQNVARVANDGLAVAAGIAGMSVLLFGGPRTLPIRALVAALLVAAGIWSKQTGLTLIPALVFGLPLIGRAQGLSSGRLWRITGMATSALLLSVAPLWVWSYQSYGAVVTTQESVELAARGPLLEALLASVRSLDWASLIERLFVPGTVWVGGWSFLPMNAVLAAVHGWYWGALVATAAVGAVIAARQWPTPARMPTPPPNGAGNRAAVAGLAVCATVVIVTATGMVHHALVSNALFGRSTTNPWYFMTALPFLFVLLARGLEAVNRTLAMVAVAALAGLYVAIDLHGTWVQMPAHYASTTDAALQWSRLSMIHPAVLSGDLRWVFLAVHLGTLALAAAGILYAYRRRPHRLSR